MSLDIQICKASEAVNLVTLKEREQMPFHAVISIEHLCDEQTPVEEGRAPRLAEIIGREWQESALPSNAFPAEDLTRKWKDRQLILECNDAPGPEFGIAMPDPQIVYDSIAHAKRWWPEEGDFRLLIHCHQGISRSPAIALVLMRYFRGPGTEQQCLDDLLKLRPPAMPNATIIEHGDRILGCDGELIRVFQEAPCLAEGHKRRLLARQRRLAQGGAPAG